MNYKIIPPKIHYCWFGNNPLPSFAKKCIESWCKYLPHYEIIEWNEKNYNVYKIPYTTEAYKAKKYAFVSDYARFDILYQNGGIYFDTDVEVIKSMEDILDRGPFFGCEIDGKDEKTIQVNPGLGFAAYPKMDLYRQVIEHYKNARFINEDGSLDLTTVVTRLTNILNENGLINNNDIQEVKGINVYPSEFFNPLNDNTGKLTITENTHTIHWYSKTWQTSVGKLKGKLTRPFHRVFGEKCFRWFKNFIQ